MSLCAGPLSAHAGDVAYDSGMTGRNHRICIVLAAANGLIAVAAGAFAAHGLKPRLSPDMLAIFETAARYQMYHALAMLAAAVLARGASARSGWFAAASGAFQAGIVVFSGSLYVLALSGVRAWGAVTPIGGAAFLLGWLLLAVAAWRDQNASREAT